MRVVAGKLGGRVFDSPAGHRTHPMSEKVRGALFNMLGDLEGLSVLDAFAGSGALSFEAISRGAESALAVDLDKLAITTVVKSISALGLQGRVKAVQTAVNGWLATSADMFDIVLADPPYDDVRPALLQKLAERAKIGGIVVFSLPPDADVQLTSDFQQLAAKDYGDATLVFYRRSKVE